VKWFWIRVARYQNIYIIYKLFCFSCPTEWVESMAERELGKKFFKKIYVNPVLESLPPKFLTGMEAISIKRGDNHDNGNAEKMCILASFMRYCR
jgi:hypothetical protein